MIDYVIDYHAGALVDSGNAYIWYELQQKGLGERFLKEVERTKELISLSPEVYGAKSRKGYREALVKDFPYLIVYKVYPKKKRIFVSAIHHEKMNPNKKYRK